MKKISIFTITRGRPKLLQSLIDSIIDNVSDVSKVELWVGWDEDDTETESVMESVEKNGSPIDIYSYKNSGEGTGVCHTCDDPVLNRHADMLTPMSQESNGDYLWVLNDDVTIQTANFDLYLEDFIEHYLSDKPDRIAYCQTHEIFRLPDRGKVERDRLKAQYSCYPLITRELFNALGFFLPHELPQSGSDMMMGKLISSCKYDRYLYIPSVTIYDAIAPAVKKNSKPHNVKLHFLASDYRSYSNSIDAYIQAQGSELKPLKPFGLSFHANYKCKSCQNTVGIDILMPHESLFRCYSCGVTNYIQEVDVPDETFTMLGQMQSAFIGSHFMIDRTKQQSKEDD